MSTIRAVLWDVGGVLLTNGWDHEERGRVLARFGVDTAAAAEFEKRHPEANDAWERGSISLAEYLDRTLFYQPRGFSPADFVAAMKAESRLLPGGAIRVLAELEAGGAYLLGMLNNEARELNDYRIEQFSLEEYFDVFLSSCYVGMRKPEERMFQLALDVLQIRPEEIVFVDDRAGNTKAASSLGFRAIQYTSEADLRRQLAALDIPLAAAEP
jgi:putative hydrolase of the HAD superfamily